MKRGVSPGVLIGIVFAIVAVFFGILIVTAVSKQQRSAVPATAPPPPPPALTPASATVAPSLPAATLPPTVPTGALAKAPGTTTYTIQSLNETTFDKPVTDPIPVPSGGAITLVGWAVDTAATNLAGGVIVSVDETINYQATYGLARPDVAAVLGNPVYTKSGFMVTFPASILTRGMHTITIKILTSDGKSYYQPDQHVAITVT